MKLNICSFWRMEYWKIWINSIKRNWNWNFYVLCHVMLCWVVLCRRCRSTCAWASDLPHVRWEITAIAQFRLRPFMAWLSGVDESHENRLQLNIGSEINGLVTIVNIIITTSTSSTCNDLNTHGFNHQSEEPRATFKYFHTFPQLPFSVRSRWWKT